MDDGQIDKEDYKYDLSIYIYISGYIDIYMYRSLYQISVYACMRAVASLIYSTCEPWM